MTRRPLGLALAGLAIAADNGPFTIAPSQGARFELNVYKTGLLSGKKHIFVFDRYRGTFDGTRIEFVVEGASIQCLDDWTPASGKKDEILAVAKKDLLDVAKFPEIKFAATVVPGKPEQTGTLAIKGIAKPITVTFERTEDGWLIGRAQLKHSTYGLKQQTAALGTIGTKDEMDVSFRLRIAEAP